jgi:hypothetical protein
MNFAILSKFNNNSSRRTLTIKELATIVRRKTTPGLNETTYYLSTTNPDIFYALQLMYDLEAISSKQQVQEELVYYKRKLAAQLEECLIFKLHWEYRRLNLVPTLSTLRVLSFPSEYSQEQISEGIEGLKQYFRQFIGLTGIWVGYNYNSTPARLEDDKLLCLIRTDWLNQKTYLDFTNATDVQDTIQRSMAYTTEISFATGQMINIYQPDTLIENNENNLNTPTDSAEKE